MWCATCQAEVAAEVSSDTRRVRCATCGSDILNAAPARTSTRTKEARELLERWTSGRLLDPLPQTAKSGADAADVPAARTHESSTAPPPQASLRMDAGHAAPHAPAASQGGGMPAGVGSAPWANAGPAFRLDHPHSVPSSPGGESHFAPHWDRYEEARRAENLSQEISEGLANLARPRKSAMTVIGGQVLAYSGVALLTVGTTLVLWGHFGGPQSYTPTGWLVATAGQMLLFLGVITLVSGGMEQTTEEVGRKIDLLARKLVRVEQVTREHVLRGPHFSTDPRAQDFSAGPQAPGHSANASHAAADVHFTNAR